MTLAEAMEELRSVAAGARGSNRALRAVHEVIAAYDAERAVKGVHYEPHCWCGGDGFDAVRPVNPKETP